MRRRELHLLFGAVLMSLLMALPSVSGCAPGEVAPPPEEKYVTFISLTDLTGPSAGFMAPVEEAYGFYFGDLNSRGGVDGVKVRLITVDTRYDVARTTSAYKRYRTEHKICQIFIPNTAAIKALSPIIEADRYIALTGADGYFQAHLGRIFLTAPPYQDGCAASLDWIAEDWRAKGKPGVPTVGYMHWDNPFGRAPLEGGKEYAEEIGINLLEPEFFPPGCLDHSVYLSRIAKAGADYCLIGGVAPTPSNILRDAHKLGLTEIIQFVDTTYLGFDDALGMMLHPEASEGAVICSPLIRGDEARNLPGVVDLWTKHTERPIAEMRAMFPLPLVAGRDFAEGLRIALEDVGYDRLDGEAMYQAYQRLAGFDREGLGGSCCYSLTSRRSADITKFYRVVGGKNVPITDWIKMPDAVSLHRW